MTDRWFYTTDRKTKLGPLTTEQLHALAHSGTLTPDALVLKEGERQWSSSVAVLAATKPPTPAAPPPLPPALPMPPPLPPRSIAASKPWRWIAVAAGSAVLVVVGVLFATRKPGASTPPSDPVPEKPQPESVAATKPEDPDKAEAPLPPPPSVVLAADSARDPEADPEPVVPENRDRDTLTTQKPPGKKFDLPLDTALAEKAIAGLKTLFGPDSEEVGAAMEALAMFHELREDYASARKSRAEALRIWTKLDGADDWMTDDARLALQRVDWLLQATPEQRRQAAEATRDFDRADALYKDHKEPEALALFGQVLESRVKLFGENHADCARTMRALSAVQRARKELDRSEELLLRAQAIQQRVLVKNHPELALTLNHLGGTYRDRHDFGKAQTALLAALKIFGDAYGNKHLDYVNCQLDLARLYASYRYYERAEMLFIKDLERLKPLLGERHPDYIQTMYDLASTYRAHGEFALAEPLSTKAHELTLQSVGEKTPKYVETLNALAIAHRMSGNFAAAEPLLQKALVLRKEIYGEQHPSYAYGLRALAAFHRTLGDNEKAEPFYLRAIEIYRASGHETTAANADCLSSLAVLYTSRGDYARAEKLYRRAIEINKLVQKESSRDYIANLSSVAGLVARRDFPEAEVLYKRSLELSERYLTDKHVVHCTTLSDLALLYQKQGDVDRAEPLLRQAMATCAISMGDRSPHYFVLMQRLADLYHARGDLGKAELYYRKSLELSLLSQGTAAEAQSERQQMITARKWQYFLDNYLSVSGSRTDPYFAVLAVKGAVLSRQRDQRLSREVLSGKSAEAASVFAELQGVSRRLSALALGDDKKTTAPAERQKQLAALSEEKERLERDLSRLSAEYRRGKQAAVVTPEQVRAALPRGTALVDILEYRHTAPDPARKGALREEPRLVAFVLRPDRDPVRIDLGPSAIVPPLIERWRSGLRRRQPSAEEAEAGAELRRCVWQPLEPALEGVTTVILSPFGSLTSVPFGALPGKEPGKYLIEEVGIVMLSVPRQLPELIAAEPPARDKRPSLLLVGDVDYGADPSSAAAGTVVSRDAARGGVSTSWQRLPGTLAEVEGIDGLYRKRYGGALPSALRGGAATEAAVKEQAPRHRWLHFATHGFFAPPTVRSALAATARREGEIDPFGNKGVVGFNPGLLSGLVLAGANRGPGPDHDDGILTATEVSELDLRGVELVVLSACETGLGQSAGGEGLLGLQRAFQAAGARSTVASLWSVPDDPTRLLMERFYANLLERNLPKLEALREAQLWLLREGRSLPGLTRGLEREDAPQPLKDGRLPPYYWAAFVLSGDWR